jgi:hypothetical protein
VYIHIHAHVHRYIHIHSPQIEPAFTANGIECVSELSITDHCDANEEVDCDEHVHDAAETRGLPVCVALAP